MQVEVLRVFRIMFDLLFEKLPCRGNLQAQDRVRWSRLILFAKIVILDLVLETIFSNKQHLGRVSICCNNELSSALANHRLVLLHLNFP